MSEPIRIVGGRPSDEELAALVVVLMARRTTAAEDPAPPSRWRDRTRVLRAPLMAGPGAWRASALPY